MYTSTTTFLRRSRRVRINVATLIIRPKTPAMLAKVLRPRLSIFLLNVYGLFLDFKQKKLIKDIKDEKPSFTKISNDVTGGMKRKVDEAYKISKMGLKVFFTNGNKPERIINAIKRNKFEGTLFRG